MRGLVYYFKSIEFKLNFFHYFLLIKIEFLDLEDREDELKTV